MVWTGPKKHDPPSDTYLQNLAKTPYINSERSVLLTFDLDIGNDYSGVGRRLDVYRSSSFGLLTSKLASYSGGVQYESIASVSLCLPTGRFQLAFLAYSDVCCASNSEDDETGTIITLYNLQLTKTECTFPTQTGNYEHLITRIKPFLNIR